MPQPLTATVCRCTATHRGAASCGIVDQCHGRVDYAAANGSSIKNCGEKKIAGYADAGESVSKRVQCADAKKLLCSVHKMNMGGNVVVLDGEKSYMQHKESGRRTRIEYEDGQYVMYLWIPARMEEVQGETEKVLRGNRFAILATENEQVFSRRV